MVSNAAARSLITILAPEPLVRFEVVSPTISPLTYPLPVVDVMVTPVTAPFALVVMFAVAPVPLPVKENKGTAFVVLDVGYPLPALTISTPPVPAIAAPPRFSTNPVIVLPFSLILTPGLMLFCSDVPTVPPTSNFSFLGRPSIGLFSR